MSMSRSKYRKSNHCLVKLIKFQDLGFYCVVAYNKDGGLDYEKDFKSYHQARKAFDSIN